MNPVLKTESQSLLIPVRKVVLELKQVKGVIHFMVHQLLPHLDTSQELSW